MLPFRLTDSQLRQLTTAAATLDPAKRSVLLERLAGSLRFVHRPSDRDVAKALQAGLQGLQQLQQGRPSDAA